MNTDRNRNSKIIEPDAERIVTARARLVAFGLAILLGVSTLAALTTALVLEIQAGATAYIVGEGHWSKARQDAVKHLYVYSINGDEQHLQRVREALAVPLGDRAARLALERSPPDLDAAREGFLAGGNDPDDISRLIWMYRWFSDQRFFRDAVDVWREADDHILSLAALAQTIEELVIQHGIEHPRLPELRAEVLGVAMVLRPMELEFSSILARGARWLHSLLLAASTCCGWL